MAGWISRAGFLRCRLERDPSKRKVARELIYKNYLKSGRVRAVSEEVKDAINECLEEGETGPELFDEAVRQVMENMMKTTFARFIQSDVYIQHVQDVQDHAEDADSTPPTDYDHGDDLDPSKSSVPANPHSEGDMEDLSPPPVVERTSGNHSRLNARSNDITNRDNNNDNYVTNQMPTLDEDEESTLLPPRMPGFRKPGHADVPPPRPPQSKMIMLQKRQSQLGLKYGEQIVQPGYRPPPNPYHVNNSCYVPPSAVHSDMQSMSSGMSQGIDLDTDGKRIEHYRRHSSEMERRKPPR